MHHSKNALMQFKKRILQKSDQVLKVPADQKSAINFIVRGFENRQIFCNNMKGDGGGKPGGAIADAVKSLWNFFGA